MSAVIDSPGVQPHEVAAEELVASFAEADHHVVDLSGFSFEDWVCLGFFWLMSGLVFLQFFSRYVLNDSYAWTEELAVYCLIPVVFIGSAMCVRREPDADRIRRGLPRAAERHRRRAGKSAHDHRGEEVLRGAEEHRADRPHRRSPEHRDLRRALEEALRRRQEDLHGCGAGGVGEGVERGRGA